MTINEARYIGEMENTQTAEMENTQTAPFTGKRRKYAKIECLYIPHAAWYLYHNYFYN